MPLDPGLVLVFPVRDVVEQDQVAVVAFRRHGVSAKRFVQFRDLVLELSPFFRVQQTTETPSEPVHEWSLVRVRRDYFIGSRVRLEQSGKQVEGVYDRHTRVDRYNRREVALPPLDKLGP